MYYLYVGVPEVNQNENYINQHHLKFSPVSRAVQCACGTHGRLKKVVVVLCDELAQLVNKTPESNSTNLPATQLIGIADGGT